MDNSFDNDLKNKTHSQCENIEIDTDYLNINNDEDENNDVDLDEESKEEIDDVDDDDVDDDDDDDDDIDNENDYDEEDERKLQEIKNLKEITYISPYYYDNHLKLINLLTLAGEYEDLKKARYHMSSIFPLSPKLWLDWLKDEMKYNINEGRDEIFNLFERAVQDYLSIEIWIEYLNYALIFAKEDNLFVKIKKIFDDSLMHVGLHPKSNKIWYLNHLFVRNDENIDEEKKIFKLFDLYKRNLSIPFLNMEVVYEEFCKWFSDIKKKFNNIKLDENNLIQSYNKAKNDWNNLKHFEESLNNSCDVSTYYNYIDFEIQNKCPNRIQFIFERAITDHCLDSDLWLKYLDYINKALPFFNIIDPIFKRAIKNVPWRCEIWTKYLNTLEKFDRPENDLLQIFEKALSVGFLKGEDYNNIWLCYLEYKRRKSDFSCEENKEKLSKIFEAAIDHLDKVPNGNINFIINRFLAKVYAKYFKNIDKAREILNSILKQKNSIHDNISFWLEYASLERLYGDEKSYINLLLKALKNCPNDYDQLSNQLLRYCKEECDNINEIDRIQNNIKEIKEKIEENNNKLLLISESENKRKNKSFKNENSSKKFKLSEKTNDEEIFKKPYSLPVKTELKLNEESKFKHKNHASDENILQTVVVKNLDFNLNEKSIEKVFSKFGKILDIRLVKNYKGKSKGFCYIEYSSIEEAKTALKNDRLPINDRPAFICEMNCKQEFKFKNELERNKLFVSNLPLNIKLENLKKIFQEFDNLKDIRLATYRNGHSKGIAYVEFKDDTSASKALLKTDGMKIGDKKINVAISNPSKKNLDNQPNNLKILGAGLQKKRLTFSHIKPKVNL